MNEIIKIDDIKSKIYTIRGKQVMLDRDLAELYGVETRVINQQVKRNIERFDDDFMFQLTIDEFEILKSQIVISSWGGVRKLPYAFTEQGVYMLATVLKSKTAIEVTKQIMRTFTKMREFLTNNTLFLERFEKIETRLSIHDEKINQLFNALQTKKPQIQGVFHNGQIYDAYAFINELFKKAKKEIILVDNYCDDSVLTLFSKYKNLKYTIITKNISKQFKLDIEKYNSQYNNLNIRISNKFHDRFLIFDNEAYHLGASLKDLGKKVFAFNKIDINLLKGLL